MPDAGAIADLGSVAGLPGWHPPLEVLEIAELVLTGVLDGVPWALEVPAELSGAEKIMLEDVEGTPVATLLRPANAGAVVRFEALRPFATGPVRSARRTPAQVMTELTGGERVLGVVVTSVLGAEAVREVLARAEAAGRTVLLLAVFGAGRPSALPADGLWRAVRGLAEDATVAGVRSVAVPVAVPLLPGPADAADVTLLNQVAHAYGAQEVVTPTEGEAVLHPRFAVERERAVPPPWRRGVTVFFTGLSGSGKSTVAKALADRLAESGARTVSLLDGDEVRRMLSAGLGFSRADRDLNIRRIGFVAAEVNRHGGLAICAPIAPFAETRAAVRAGIEAVGDFVLVHISTPLAECERRDRKGLYAKARQGLIPDFTGISSPYEEPLDADLRLDTSDLPVAEAVAAVWELLIRRGYLKAS